MIDIEKLAQDMFGTVLVNGKEYYEIDSKEWDNLAEAYAAKVLEDKEREIAELKSTVKKWQENSVDLEYSCLDKNILITELQVNNNRLREAFWNIRSCYGDGYEVDNIARQALSKTPAQSLIEHDNEVIEKCAKAIDEMVVVYTNNCDRYKTLGDEESTERNVNKGRAAISCAEVIRALKGN